ncbi:conserved hypothetical protein [Hyella patelloides LEGE 07179]|uniref:DUF4359 domain-containing protein n=1 Tax=Hyella patelloides LEGE 07179 TaxID=945734 RepID=A0A563W0X7_9CYAN|nr:DUF4359 domain-containing protein [Hyella patelloides]VEP17277.1 conserved hypothetical protein [Hyella patelloides LEGE 07179]
MNSLILKISQLIIIVLIAVLVVTNPGNNKYQSYASARLITYLKDDLCSQVTEQISEKLRSPCVILIDTARPQIQAALNRNTKQQNFLLFSIYQTELSISPVTPEYHFATLGIFDKFFTYQIEKNE